MPVRKPGKLPWDTHAHSTSSSTAPTRLEVHRDALTADDRVLIVDDVLATGGTVRGRRPPRREAGGEVIGFGFVIELLFLGGRAQLGNALAHSLVTYD